MKAVKNVIYLIIMYVTVMCVTSVMSCGAEHTHKYTALYTVRPTCTESGYTVFSCACGESYEGEQTNSLGHIFSSEKVYYKKATCAEKGEAGRYCQRCYAMTDIIYYEKTPHTPTDVTVKANCKRNGEIRKECSYCRKLYSSDVIPKISSVKLERKTYTYDGKVKSPTVTVKDSKGRRLSENKDYVLKYKKGRKKTGKYSVKITFKGNYEGSKTLYFNIRPTKVKNVSVTPSLSSVYLTWDKAKGADGYEIYLKSDGLKLIKDTEKLCYTINKISGKKLKNGTDFIFVIRSYKKSGETKIYSAKKEIKVTTKPKKCSISKISASAGKATVKAVKQSCHGYEFLLSTNKSFSNAKSVKLKGKSSNSYTFKKLIKGKRYYVKVRAYVNSGGEKYSGYYSEVKSFKA